MDFPKLDDNDHLILKKKKREMIPNIIISTVAINLGVLLFLKLGRKLLILKNPLKTTNTSYFQKGFEANKGIFYGTFMMPIFLLNLYAFTSMYNNERDRQYLKYRKLVDYYCFYKDQKIIRFIEEKREKELDIKKKII